MRPALPVSAPEPEAVEAKPKLDPDLLILRGSGIGQASIYDDIKRSEEKTQGSPEE